MTDLEALQQTALRIREHILTMGTAPSGTHVGGSLSVTDILTALYFHVLRLRPDEPDWPERDYLILSKGHASAALYATLAERGFFPVAELTTYARTGGRLWAHPTTSVPGVEFPTGSLGHGLGLGIGLALAAQRDGRANRTFVVLGDGELQEGSVWESIMAAAHLKLDHLIAIVDRNRLQISGRTEQRMHLEPLLDRWQSFGWRGEQVDGHDLAALIQTLERAPAEQQRPTVLIAQTVKGRGVAFMEDRKKSHHVTLSAELHRRACRELHHGEAVEP
ncbi:MAG TPA: transketolase [Herpetosiphonaceae bacterium]